MEFNKLKIVEIRKEAADSVMLTFEVEENLIEKYKFKAGQYLTLKSIIDNEDVRRSYSLCSAPHENKFSVLVKKIPNGKFSSYANEVLKEGDEIDVMTPMGNFTPELNDNMHYTFISAGSGITPVISSVKEILHNTNSRVDLFFLNRSKKEIIFKEELESIKNKNIDRFSLNYLLSREEQETKILNGRIDKEKCSRLAEAKLLSLSSNGYFLCGPEEMILSTKEFLIENNVKKEDVHFELFNTSKSVAQQESNLVSQNFDSDNAQLTIILDGLKTEFNYDNKNSSILDFAIDKGLDLPFSCKGGVCCTCRAKVKEGKVDMRVNYALTDEEVEEGFVLTCQSFPLTSNIIVDFDEN